MSTKVISKSPATRPARRHVSTSTRPPARTKGSPVAGGLVHVDASAARDRMSELIGRVSYGHEHIAVDKHGKPRAVLIPLGDYEHYRKLEDYMDGLEGVQALEDFEKAGRASVSSDEVLRKLGAD